MSWRQALQITPSASVLSDRRSAGTATATSRHASAPVPEDRDVGLAQRCALQAAELSLLSGVADALTGRADIDVAICDVLAATLDAARISKGALILRAEGGILHLRHHIGFLDAERVALQTFFGHLPLLDEIVARGEHVCVPSSSVSADAASALLLGAHVASLQIVPLMSGGHGIGAMIIGASHSDVAGDDSVAFARAIGNHIVQSLELARSVSKLRTSEQRYRTLLEGASDAIAVLTLDGIVREVNHRWKELTGLPSERLIGRHIWDFALASKNEANVRTFNEAVAAHTGQPVAVEIAGSGGARVLIECSSTRVEVGGEPLVLTISRDVTEHRLLEDRLHQAQKLEGIGLLAGGVAHDFNNLLTAILGFSDIVMKNLPPDDPARAGLLEIEQAGERAAALTRQLLTFSRKQVLEPRVLDINAIIAGVEPMLRRLIFESIELTVALTPSVGLISMDPTQIEQILVNLAVNAADAMPAGGKLTIETTNVMLDEHDQRRHLPVPAGAYVMLAVSDTGVGMDEATTARVFEPFFSTKGVGRGTGLGLATVYGIVKQSGGDIWVYSEPGLGSTFKIYLPQSAADAPRLQPAASTVAEIVRGVETILLVEDDVAVRRLTRAVLERSGYCVVDACNPREAVQLARDFPGKIHLLLSDVIMPESEGPPLYERLSTARPNLRVLYMSGYADEAIIRRGALVEGMPFLQKPFTPGVLGRKVRDVLDAPPVRLGPCQMNQW
jgi:two-component system cell cycle sensor histidine kinase/response regulator CckA